ncbi:putative gamma-glutamylcyclotransferase At3g02910 [Andrographis paniculata]|uniref:putative gamma-glutamylcyclotransferase At3g02910 n=1 Tax=Andrographis paniculata TaxID=175694 RepID=UPI0021E83C1B|nr:putative gamma-glutamylcyclotransferase At3g02910 [Andrographis paniculata]
MATAAAEAEEPAARTTARSLIFVYGTLKEGFPNHSLLQDMVATGDVAAHGPRRTVHRLPLVCGPYGIPFLLNFPGHGHRVSGEIYAVSPAALAKLDELEGILEGHYERLPIEIESEEAAPVEAYFGHHSFAEALWRRSHGGEVCCYTEGAARGYVGRRHRPPHITFLQHIHTYVSSSSSSSSSPR